MPKLPGAPSRRFPVWETVAIFVAIASLWPAYILGWEGPGWRILSYVMLAVMATVFVRRLLAFERLKDEADAKRRRTAAEQGRARLPWEPPAGRP